MFYEKQVFLLCVNKIYWGKIFGFRNMWLEEKGFIKMC